MLIDSNLIQTEEDFNNSLQFLQETFTNFDIYMGYIDKHPLKAEMMEEAGEGFEDLMKTNPLMLMVKYEDKLASLSMEEDKTSKEGILMGKKHMFGILVKLLEDEGAEMPKFIQ